MTNSRFLSPVLLCGLVVVCGCTSMKGASDKWSTAWKKSTESKPADPNHEEVVTYWGQKKKEPKPAVMPPELKERLAKKADDSQRSRDYADNFKAGNLRLKEGRLDEARRSYELALAARPDDPDVHHRLAVVADKQQMFGAADDHYEAALRRRPRDPNLLSDIGYSHILRGDDKRAEKTLREALAVDPSHQGAMLNLSTLFGKQGRYDDALALLRQGTTEEETKKYMAKLFPQGSPSRVALVSNQDEHIAVKDMTLDQLKAEMDRRQAEANKNRQQQLAQNPSQRDWMGDSQVQDQRPTIAPNGPNNPAWMQGQPTGNQIANSSQANNPAFGQPSPYSQPGTTTIPLPSNLQSSSPMQPYSGNVPSGTAPQPGFAAGPLVAPPGTSPDSNMPFWNGAPVQPNGGTSNPHPAQYLIEQMSHSQEGPAGGGISASHAAAQLGMSAGPGSLFPIVASEPAQTGGMNMHPSMTPNHEKRFGSEFAQPPQYQNPNNQYAPSGVPNQGRIPPMGGDSAASNQFLPNWSDAMPSRSNSVTEQRPAGSDMTIAPPSPANTMSRPWDTIRNEQQFGSNGGSGVVQAGGSSPWNQTASRNGDPLDSFQPDVNSGSSRYAKTPWNDPTSQPGGSRPYNGAWPNSNSLPNATLSGSGNAPNSLPMWNGGNGAGTPNQSGVGSASGNSPQQWPYSPSR